MKLSIDDARQVDLGSIDPSKIKSYGVGSVVVMQTIVRQSMYSDPIKAVIQEYLSNGVDAHRARARVEPGFDAKTPLAIHFSYNSMVIEDSGLGISKDTMENNFASYFSSTKRDDNDDIGGFGLGCKTAFSDPNRDCFTVDTVYRDGDRTYFYRTYHYISKQGLTAYAELSHQEVPPDTGTGTKIILPIDESDLAEYGKAIRRVCKHWDIKPTVTGLDDFEYDLVNPTLEGSGDGDGFLGWHYEPKTGRIDVVIESIPYEVNQSLLPDSLTKSEPGLTLFFQNGSIPVTSTRESLDYRGDTVDRITQAAVSAVSEIKTKLRTNLDQMDLWGACDAIKTFGEVDGYEWMVHGTHFDKPASVFTRFAGDVKVDRTNYVLASRDAVMMFCGYPGACKAAKGRALTYLEQNPTVKTLIVLPHTLPTYDIVAEFLNKKRVSKMIEMVASDPNFRGIPIHSDYKTKVNRRKCHKFLFEWGDGRWRKLSAEEEVPPVATYRVIPTGITPVDFTHRDYATNIEPDFAIQECNRRHVPPGWTNVNDIIRQLLPIMCAGELSTTTEVPVRLRVLDDLYWDGSKLDPKLVEARAGLPKLIKQILKLGDDFTNDFAYQHYERRTGTDLDNLGLDRADILAKVLRRYEFPAGSLKAVLAKIKNQRREATKSKRKALKQKYDSILAVIRKLP